MRTKFRLLPTFFICIAALVLLTGGSIFFLNVLAEDKIISILAGRSVTNHLNALEIALRAHLDAARHQADFVADAIRNGDPDVTDRDRLADFTQGSLAAEPDIKAVIVAGNDGNLLRLARGTLGGIERGWYRLENEKQLAEIADETRRRKEPYLAAPIYGEKVKTTLMNLRVPVWRNQDYLGFVAVGISTDSLSELAQQLSNPPYATVFVLYGRDRVLALPELPGRDSELSAVKPLLGRSEIDDPVIRNLDDARPIDVAWFVAPEGSEVLHLGIAGTRYFVIMKTITDYSDPPILIGYYSLASAVDAPLRARRHAIIMGVGLLVLGLFMAVGLGLLITRPIRRAAESSLAFASLDFERVTPLLPSRFREIDDLAVSFNAMLVGLRSFGRYVPRALVKRLIRQNKVGAGIEECELTGMFTDMAGFTTTCETMSPAEVAAFINHHLALVCECIEREGGTIDKYIGDAVMAFWGAPDSVDDAPLRACRAAVAIQSALSADNKKRAAAGFAPVRIRIGIHTGLLIVGDIGAPSRINYTVMGDVVNAAQRLESLGKDVDAEAESIVLISRTTRDKPGSIFMLSKAGRFRMKGKQRVLGVYRIDMKNPAPRERDRV